MTRSQGMATATGPGPQLTGLAGPEGVGRIRRGRRRREGAGAAHGQDRARGGRREGGELHPARCCPSAGLPRLRRLPGLPWAWTPGCRRLGRERDRSGPAGAARSVAPAGCPGGRVLPLSLLPRPLPSSRRLWPRGPGWVTPEEGPRGPAAWRPRAGTTQGVTDPTGPAAPRGREPGAGWCAALGRPAARPQLRGLSGDSAGAG